MTRFLREGIWRWKKWLRKLKCYLGDGCWKGWILHLVFFMNGVGTQGFALIGSGGRWFLGDSFLVVGWLQLCLFMAVGVRVLL
jgi:hypothetical protein